MKEIKLTQGKVAIIDNEDFDSVSQMKWFAVKGKNTFYAATNIGPWRERKMLALHHFIIGKPSKGMFVDHIDRDGLNNQKSNLRHCTVKQNSANRTSYGTSKYLGVSAVRKNGTITRWRAFIGVAGKSRYLGIYKDEAEAAKRYNEEAIKIHGEFANLNKIPQPESILIAEYDNEIGATIISKCKQQL